MAQKLIRVVSPQTSDGVNLVIDPETDKIVTRETILAEGARPGIESINKGLPLALQHKIFAYTEDQPDPKPGGGGKPPKPVKESE